MQSTHGEIAYNVYRYNSVKINDHRRGEVYWKQINLDRRVDYYEIDHEKFGPPTHYRDYFDTIGYGTLIGLLWKITGSLNFLDIQILQILLFALMIILFFYIGLMLFGEKVATYSCIALLAFFPATYLNVQVFRSIWPFYSSVVLAYVSLAFLLKNKSWVLPIAGGTFVALCQFMRPAAFILLLTISTVLIATAFFTNKYKRTLLLIFILFFTNILFFWIPFGFYNKKVFNRYIVNPSGINLFCSLGEFKNPWGYQLSDGWYANFMKKNHPKLNSGTPECDDKAKEYFYKAIKERPLFYPLNVLKRIPRLIFPGLPWFNYQDTHGLYTMYMHGTTVKELLRIVLRKPIIFWDFVARHIYIGLFLLLAYLGIFLALIRKKYFAVVFLLLGIIAAGCSVVFLHTEHRYLIPYYTFFSFFVGYLLSGRKNV
jgi:hypothetical protein